MSTSTKKHTAEILDSVRIDSQGKLFLNINSSKDNVPFDEVEIPVHVRRKYELGNADLGGLVRSCVYTWSKQGILNKVKATPWDDGLGEQPKNKRPKRPTKFLRPEEPKEPARKKKKGGEGEDEEKDGKVRIWAARGFFEFISGAEYEDCFLWKLTTDDNKCREGALVLNVRLMKYNGFELKDTTQVETSEGEVSPCAPGLFILFPAGWRRKTPVQINRGSKRFIFAAREKNLSLIQEANRRKREAKGNSAEPRSSGRPKKLKFGSLEESEKEEDVTADTKPKTKGKKGSQSKQEKQEKQKPPKETEGSRVCLSIHGAETLSISRSLFSPTQPDLARFGELMFSELRECCSCGDRLWRPRRGSDKFLFPGKMTFCRVPANFAGSRKVTFCRVPAKIAWYKKKSPDPGKVFLTGSGKIAE
eukprot:g55932.t1